MSVRVFYDYQAFGLQLYGGISRYFCELITGLTKTDNKAHLSLLHSNNVHLREYGLDFRSQIFPKRQRFLRATNRYYNLIDTKFNKFDIYHPTYYDPFLISHIGSKPYVVTYYDMIHEKFCHQYQPLHNDKNIIDWKKVISKEAAGLIAISENTKNDMVDYLGVSPERIKVIYLSSSMKINTKDIVNAEISKRPYLLYVGNRDIYKNFTLFLTAVAPILKRYGIRLICAGGGGFNKTEWSLINAHGVESYIEQHSITDQTLAQLYSNAVAFVFPSLYEGFGIPILEAMSCQCPCILSNCSSMPEVAGKAASYFNPEDADDMRSAIIKVMDDKMYRDSLVEGGLKRASGFSWERTVRETISFYDDIVAMRN